MKLKANTFSLFKTSSVFASLLKPSHSSMYDFQKVYILPTEIIYVFCTVVGRKSNYSLEQHTYWFLQQRRELFTVRYELKL